MHIIEAQSLSSGQEIQNVFLYDKYFPLPFEGKYIVFAPISKESKCYSHWGDVLNIIVPILSKNNIRIIQIGAKDERPYNGCIHLMGQTQIPQVAFLVKNSIGVLSTDTFVHHIADSYGIKSVVIISNNYKRNVGAFFNPANQIAIEPPYEEGQKPCLSLQDPLRMIDKINPEIIAENICKMLDIPFDWAYKTLYVGDISHASMVISCLDTLVNPAQLGLNTLITDLTINDNINFDLLLQQLQICPCSILTSKPLDDKIFQFNKQVKRIPEIVYEITEDNSPEFVRTIIKNGIPFKLISKLPLDKINELKLKYFEMGVIWPIKFIDPKNIESLKNEDLNSLFIKSSKFYLSSGLIYPSKAHLAVKKNVTSFDEILPIENNDLFWTEVESMKILKKS